MATMMSEIYDPATIAGPIGVFGDNQVYQLATRAAGTTRNLTGIDLVEVGKWDASSPFNPAPYRRVASEPDHSMKFQDATGAWFGLTPGLPLYPLEWAGILVDNESAAATNRSRFHNLLNALDTMGGGAISLPPATVYLARDSAVLTWRSSADA